MSALFSLRDAARALGGDVVAGQILAPGPCHSRLDRSLSVRFLAGVPDGFLVYSHAGDNFTECRDHVRERLGLADDAWRSRPARTAAPNIELDAPTRDEDERKIYRAASIVRGMVPLRGSPGEAYLRDARRIDVKAIADVLDRSDAIGWHPQCLFHQTGHALHRTRVGAIVGIMTDPATGEATGGISRTYVHEGRKVEKAKGLGPAGIVRLSEDAEVLGGLFIGEGLETCLAGMAIGLRPIWSTGSTAQMVSFPVLAGIEALTIIADHDENGAGERAARTCAHRWANADREVSVHIRQTFGDLNDAAGELQ